MSRYGKKAGTGVGEQLREVAAEIVPDLQDETSFDSDAASDNELQRRAAKTHDHLNKIRKAVEVLASQANEVVAEWRKSRDESSWKQSVEAAAQAYQELTENLSREGAGDPAAYGELVQRRQVIEQRLEKLDERKKQVDDLNNQADAHLQHFAGNSPGVDGVSSIISQFRPKRQPICPDTGRPLWCPRDGRKRVSPIAPKRGWDV